MAVFDNMNLFQRTKVYVMNQVFISECKTKYICLAEGVPCFTRSTHQQIIKSKGLNMDNMVNLTFKFYYEGKGQSIKNFLK